MVGGSHWVLRLLPPLKMIAMILLNLALSTIRFNNHFLYFTTKTNCLKRYILANIIIVLLFPIAAICRLWLLFLMTVSCGPANRRDWEKKK
jgi:hypothetical protein